MAHQTASPQISREMQECIEECLRCHGICLQTVSHCLELGGKHADPDHIGLLLDCAEICRTSAELHAAEFRPAPAQPAGSAPTSAALARRIASAWPEATR